MPVVVEKLVHGLVFITAMIFGLWYLSTLMLLALFVNIVSKNTPKDPQVKLSAAEQKLVFDLAYYIELSGFKLERHRFYSSDGFGLEVARIVGGPTSTKGNDFKKPYPVLLLPGLMQHSAAYCTAGPDAMALTLARAGFDVWLGNTRSNFHLRNKHFSSWSSKMWNWSIDDMAKKDVPCIIENIRRRTGAPNIAVAAHSQGTAQMFMCLSKELCPDVGKSISSFSALAPAVYAGPLVDRWFLKMLRHRHWAFRSLIGFHSFLGIMGSMHGIIPIRIFVYLAYIMFNYMLGWNDVLWDRHFRDRNFIFAPTLVSSKLMMWWLAKGGFADTKCIFKDQSTTWFDDRFPKLALFTCGRDDLCDAERLINRLNSFERAVDCTIFDLPNYSHLDVLWARDVPQQVATPMGKFIWDCVPDKEQWRAPTWNTPIHKDSPQEVSNAERDAANEIDHINRDDYDEKE